MRFAQEISIYKPHAIELAVTQLNTSITQTASEIRAEASQTAQDLGYAIQQNTTLISLTSSQILQEVRETYATITTTDTLASRIAQTAKSIEFTLSSASSGTQAKLSMKYTKEDGSVISLAAQTISFTGLVQFNDLSTSGSTTINGANIVTGSLSADKLHGGTLTLGGSSNGNGQLEVYDGSNNLVGFWNNGGLRVQDSGMTLRTTMTDGTWTVYRNAGSSASPSWQSIGAAGKFTLNSKNAFGIKAISANCAGLVLCINNTPYYALNTSDSQGGGLDFSGYGFRHYFKGEVYCDGMFKTSCGYGWAGKFGSDDKPIVFTGASVRVEGSEGNGHFYAASSMVTDGSMSAGGGCHAEYYVDDYGFDSRNYSDERMKSDIEELPIESSYKTVMGLRPVSFRFKDDDRKRHGFIAQDVLKIADWDVVKTVTDGMYGLDYQDFIADMVKVIQDQEVRISNLERGIHG